MADQVSDPRLRSLRAKAGVVAFDLLRYLRALSSGPHGYLALSNRGERLEAAPDGPGFRCDWQWTRDLHAPKVLPSLGRRLMQRALEDRPIELGDQLPAAQRAPAVSFIIGHRGRERVPLLHATLASIAAQGDAAVEAIVVEQSAQPEIRDGLPAWVRYVHVATAVDAPYNRSWAFNVGAGIARGEVLVLHDNDLLVPVDYARCILDHVGQAHEVINLKRFIFYLGERDTTEIVSRGALRVATPEAVMQNAQGGGSIAVRADTFARLGGMDEGFVGWGGEDNEFWERCSLARCWEYGYLSLVHLWHPSQPAKGSRDNPTFARQRRIAGIDPIERVRRLASTSRGDNAPRAHDPFADLLGGH
jgi:hypothetical protein